MFNLLDLVKLAAALTAVKITIHTTSGEAERARLVRHIEAGCGAADRRRRESLLAAEPVGS